MASEGFDVEEWDADFLDQLVQAEELALSTQLSHHQQPLPPAPSPQPQRAPPRDDSYSPPRELSQRIHEKSRTRGVPDCSDSLALPVTHFEKELEIDILKKELSRVSQQLIHLVNNSNLNILTRDLYEEQECSKLRKERDKKEDELKIIHSRVEAKDAEVHHTKNMQTDCLVSSPTVPGIFTVNQNATPSNKQLGSRTKSCNTGVQTDKTSEESTSAVHNVCRGSEKLFGLWNSDDQKVGRVLVSKLFITCEADFHVLFGYLNPPQNNSNVALSCPTEPIEAAKVSHLYSVLAKISNDTSRLEELLEALVDLCSLKNVVIVHRSLRVLHKILCISFSMGKKFGKRENVIIKESLSGNTLSDINECGNSESESSYFASIAEMLKQEQVPFGVKFSNVKTPGHTGFLDHSFGASISGVYWISFFGHMCQIAIENNEEEIRHEALSIMNLILMRHNAYLDRDKFAGELVFQSLSQLLGREAGFSVQDQAVHTLHLLCNCPKVIAMLCSGVNEDGEHACSQDINDKSISTFQWLNEILIGLADCVAFYGSATVEEMKLRRNAVVFLAFLASSGKSGFNILLNHRLPKGTNFLAITLRGLISDLDLQASKSAHKSGIIREQILFIREALILLNRLVSHPQYSIPVLQTLTSTRDMASTTVDVANRLTQKSKLLWQDNNTTKQIRELEIIDLAWVFKKRVFTYLGDSIS